jgi:phenylalanyl-tRNA synthetase beta chain
MRVPLAWLREYVEFDLAPESLAERLTLLGMEVQGIERWGADWKNVVVGELLSVTRHPNADRLSLTTVSVGDGPPLEIVCGATNIAPGQRVPVALPGAVLPGARRIERTEKMGVVSNGMLCSGDELRLTADADGILILPPETPIGRQLVDLYGDVVLDVDVKPNRGDALSMIGLAREVSAITGAPLRWPAVELAESGPDVAAGLRVAVEDPALCPRFVGRRVRDVRVAPSPDEIQARLMAAGMRPVSNVVDASNYVMHELGKPIHTFDAGAVLGGMIQVRLARRGESLETLDHAVRELTADTLVIADQAGPIAIAGVMGGAGSEVSDATVDVIIESAVFEPVSIRRTAFRYALRSEASLRFEKGQETRLARIGADRTAQLILAWAGGLADRGRVDTAPDEPEPSTVAFRPARVNRLLGAAIEPTRQAELLARVGIATRPAGEGTQVPVAAGSQPLSVAAQADEALLAEVPTWRRDIAVETDVAEEIARVEGYDRVASILPDTPMPAYRPSPLAVRDLVRETLVGAGLTEVVTHALVAPEQVRDLAWSATEVEVAGEGVARGRPIRVTNPLSADHAMLRQNLVASLLEVVAVNVRHGQPNVAVFEVGKGYGLADGGTAEWWRLGIALTGSSVDGSWNQAERAVEIDDLKGLVELVAERLGLRRPTYAGRTGEAILHPGRSATLTAADAAGDLGLAGRFGELHPAVVEALGVRVDRVVMAELAVRGLGGGQLAPIRVTQLDRYPGVERDLAVVVDAGRPSAEVEHVIRASAGPLLRSIRLFDIYRGQPLAANERSLAFRLVFRSPDRTLTETEVEAAVEAIVAAIAARAGGRVRT